MPRRYYRRRSYRRGDDATALVVILVLAIILLILVLNGSAFTLPIPQVNLPDIDIDIPGIPDVEIPITGLPRIIIPETEINIPITVVPGTLMPDVRIEGTPVPEGGAPVFGPQTQTTGCQFNGRLPDPDCTPGAIISTSTEQVCTPGYAASVRDVSTAEKEAIYVAYGINSRAPGQYQVDHLVPLSLGGSNDDANLWPLSADPGPGLAEKYALERYLRDRVCAGEMSLSEAQRQLATNWVEAYNAMPK